MKLLNSPIDTVTSDLIILILFIKIHQKMLGKKSRHEKLFLDLSISGSTSKVNVVYSELKSTLHSGFMKICSEAFV